MRRTLLVAAAVLLVGCACQCGGAGMSSTCDDGASLAVYHKLMPIFSEISGNSDGQINDLRVWLSHNYDPSYWNPLFNKQQKRIDEVREWAKTLSDRCVREEYLQWLTYYYQVGLDDAREELKTHRIEKEQTEFRAKGDQERKYREERERTNPIPAFPAQEGSKP